MSIQLTFIEVSFTLAIVLINFRQTSHRVVSLPPPISSVIFAMVLFGNIQTMLFAQASQTVAAELLPLVKAYETQVTAVSSSRAAMEKAARGEYLKKLVTVRDSNAVKASEKSVTAIAKEKEGFTNGVALAAEAPVDLPRELLGPRTALVNVLTRLGREYATRNQAILSAHMATLAAVEAKARQQGDTALIKEIGAEKSRVAALAKSSNSNLAGGDATETRIGLVNGDFSQSQADGLPTGWTADRGGVKVVKDGKESFARFTDGRGGQYIKVPKGAKSVQLSARIRCADLVATPGAEKAQAGVGIYSYSAGDKGKKPLRTCINLIKEKTPDWKTLTTTGAIAPNTNRIRVWMERWYCTEGTVDIDDVVVSFQ